MVYEAFKQAFACYGIMAVLSFLVAVLIKGIVVVLSSREAKSAVGEGAVAPASRALSIKTSGGVPEHHLVAIAAVAAMDGSSRIVRIDDTGLDTSWTSVGRALHQSSHDVRR